MTISTQIVNSADGIPTMLSPSKPVALLELDAPALEFLIEELPGGDAFVRDLERLREAVKNRMWMEASG